MLELNIHSEVDELEAVLIHEPGPEVENMTPATAERALYSDILNLSVALEEYRQFKSVLKSFCKVYEVRDVLLHALNDDNVKENVIHQLANFSGNRALSDQLKSLDAEKLQQQIIEGVPLQNISLTNFLNHERYLVNPLHNIFFTRDASFTIGNRVVISSMAKKIREPEAIIKESVLSHLIGGSENIIKLSNFDSCNSQLSIEGGDVLVASNDVLIIGVGPRTTPQGIDLLLKEMLKHKPLKYVLVQELPHHPESFIHLDMAFTILDRDTCMVYKPVILEESKYGTVLMEIEGVGIKKIRYVENLLLGLKECGLDFKPIYCGDGDPIRQDREQWHSGANFFALTPGKIIGYQRNVYTNDALCKAGFNVISADDVVKNKVDIRSAGKTVITIEGSELSRGGGGPRCMTMPLRRKA